MDDEEKKEEATLTPRQRMRQYLLQKNPDAQYDDENETDIDDMMTYTSQLDKKHSKMTEANKRLAEAINRDPAVGAFIAAITSGKSPSYAAARYLGRDFLSADPDSDDYNEIVKAEAERQEEIDRTRKQQEEFDANLEKSEVNFEAFAKENGMDEKAFEKYFQDVYHVLLNPIMAGDYTPEVLQRLKKAIDYDVAVADAEAAGRAAGRNEKILAQKFGTDKENIMPSLAGKTRNNDIPDREQSVFIPRQSVLERGRKNQL